MEKKDTKQIILDEALDLFAVNGYDGVAVADIANAVGIKASSLYKHYKGKQDIFDCILEKTAERYNEMAGRLGIDGNISERDAAQYSGMSTETLVETGTALFMYFLHDDYARKFRRMLTIEQYKNEAASKLYTEQYMDSPIVYQSSIFKVFIEQGKMKNVDAKVAAVHFYSPMFLMLCLCDSCPEHEPSALEFIRQHITQFSKLYMEGKIL